MTPTPPTLWAQLQGAFHDPAHPAHRWVEGTVWALILASIALVGVDLRLQGTGAPPAWLDTIDTALLWIFAAEIALRIATHTPPELSFHRLSPAGRLRAHVVGRLRYMGDPFVMIDLITVLALHPALRGLRALRLLRVARGLQGGPWLRPLRSVVQAVRDNRLLYRVAFGLVGVATFLGGASFYLIEGPAGTIDSLSDGLWWAIVTLTTVGYGDISPATGLGRVVAAALMVVGMVTLAIFAGLVGNTLLQAVMSIREEATRMSATMNHVVICGWDSGARMLLDAILVEVDPDHTELYVFAPGARPADVPPAYRWVEGDPTKESELDKVRLAYADCVLVVGPRTMSPQDADARTILTTFTLRAHVRKQPVTATRQRPLYIISEILDAENVEHARAAGADEVIETTRIGFSLLSHAIVQRGTADLLGEITAAGAHSLYVGQVPDGLDLPAPFEQVARHVKQRSGALVVGLHEAGHDTLNPPDTTPVTPGCAVIYLAESAVLPSA